MFESLRSLSDHKILFDTDAIVLQDRKLTLRLLVHLHEIERRKLYLTCGYSSMFIYCTSHLRLSEPATARRLRTARCLARFPELYTLLESGEVNLSTVSMIAKFIKPDNAAALLSRIRGKSRREVERIVAELEPRSVLPPDRVRMVVIPPTPSSPAASLRFTVAGDSEKAPTLESTTHDDRRAGDDQRSPCATVSAVLERRALIQFTASEEFMALVERVRCISSHRLPPNATFEQVFALVMTEYLKREDPQERHERREAKASAAVRPQKSSSPRQVPAHVRDRVFVRDKGRCTFVGPSGQRCDSTRHVQVDHIRPVARGGSATIGNLRLLCAYHNRLEAERLMGPSARTGRNAPLQV